MGGAAHFSDLVTCITYYGLFVVYRYAVCGMRYAVCGMRYAVCGMRYAVCGMRYVWTALPGLTVAILAAYKTIFPLQRTWIVKDSAPIVRFFAGVRV